MTPKGKLIIIGGAINTGSFTETTFGLPQNMNFFERGILKRITTESLMGTASRFEIITTASLIPEKVTLNLECILSVVSTFESGVS